MSKRSRSTDDASQLDIDHDDITVYKYGVESLSDLTIKLESQPSVIFKVHKAIS